MRRTLIGLTWTLTLAATGACGSSSSSGVAPGGGDGGADGSRAGCAPGGATPDPRGDHAGALSPDGATMILFGGDTAVAPCGGIPSHTHVGDTWLLDTKCGTFQSVPGAGPQARARHAMVTDPTGGRALLFGGRTRAGASGDYTLFSDVWSFDFAGRAWSQIATTGTAPPPRSNTAIALSDTKRTLYVFGGSSSVSGLAFTPLDDTWALDLTTHAWHQVAATVSPRPKARLFHAVAIDDARGTLYAYSGGDANAFTGPFLADLWALDLAAETWRQITPTGGLPPSRILHTMTWDTVKKQLVVFGGHDDGNTGNQNDVWTIDPTTASPTWTNLPLGDTFNKAGSGACTFPPDFTVIDKASPERRESFATGVRADGHGFIVHGGKSDCGDLADAWSLDLAAGAWSPVFASPVALSCLRYSTTCTGLCG